MKQLRQTVVTRRGGGSRHHPIAFAGFVPLQAASLSGNSRITWARSETSMAVQRAISSTVRPQPRQSPVRASRVQTLTHGVSIMGSVRIGCEHSQRRQKYNCAIVARLQILDARTGQRSAVQPPCVSSEEGSNLLSGAIEGACSAMGAIAATTRAGG